MHQRWTHLLSLAAGVVFALQGCGSGIHGPFPPVAPSPGGVVSGNWQFALAPTTHGGSGDETASGSIEESSAADGTGSFTTSVLLVQAPCFTLSPVLPLQGPATTTMLTLDSFVVNGQFIALQAQIGDGGASLSGSYSISGGCADGEKGSLTGTRIAALNGTYTAQTILSSGGSISTTLTQASEPNGDGVFLVGGSATFTGISCFQDGQIQKGTRDGFISGTDVELLFTTNEASGSQIRLSGTTNPASSQISFTAHVLGGSCNGQVGAGTLTLP